MIPLITWRQYLIFIGGATLLYYAVIVLLYYRSELKNLFTSKPATQQSPEDPPIPSQHQFVGEPEFDGQQSVCAEELFFAAPAEEEIEPVETIEQAIKQQETSAVPDENFLLGPVADFLKELKAGFGLLREADGNKEEFLTLLGILSEKYHQVMQSAYRPLLEVFILEMATEQLPFELTSEDLQTHPSIQ